MKISVRNEGRLSLEQIRAFLAGSDELEIEAAERNEIYIWLMRTLARRGIGNKAEKLRACYGAPWPT